MNLSLILLAIGILGFVLNRNNIILMLISLEIMLLAITLLILVSSLSFDDILGQTYAVYVITIARAESVIGLGIPVAYYRLRGSIVIDFKIMYLALITLPLLVSVFFGFLGRRVGVLFSVFFGFLGRRVGVLFSPFFSLLSLVARASAALHWVKRGINSPPLPHRYVDSVLESNKSYLFLFTVSSSAITLNISFPSFGQYVNTLLDSLYHTAVSNIFTDNTAVTNVINNSEAHISRLYNNPVIHNTDVLSEFVHRGNSIVDPNVLHGILAMFTSNPIFIVIVVLPLIYPLSRSIGEIIDRLARLPRLILSNILANSQTIHSYIFAIPRRLYRRLSNSQRMFSYRFAIPRRLNTCISSCMCSIKNNCCNTVKWVKDRYLSLKPSRVSNIVKCVKERNPDFEPDWMFNYNGSDRIPRELRDIVAYPLCRHSFKEIQSPNNVLNWRCGACQSGPHWLIWECIHCKTKRCRPCVAKG